MTVSSALRRLAVAGTAVAALAITANAVATTGTQTDKREKATITTTGVTWVPALRRLHPTTGTTVRFHVINQSPASHWFAVGSRRTKVLAVGKTDTFFYSFTTPGKVSWHVGLGKVTAAGFHGIFKVTFPSHFN